MDQLNPWMEENILKWSQKAQLLNTMYLKKSGMKGLLQTPIGQAQKAMEQFDKMLYKSQLKRNSFRILGENASNIQRDIDEEIYDDNDFYNELLKEYMTEIEENKEVGQDGLLFDSTRLYLLDRKLKQQEKKLKTVDRKTSKARKIRYDVHQKLVNFMNPVQQEDYIIDGRIQIVQNIFGGNKKDNNDDDKNIKKKDNQEDIDDIEII
ncbi:hypothetical protein IMG5_140270 [Ichthyophthirius multifiliis]|uniref:Apoptosis-antagonizing transcription factor C-terminal domain-containing protein n=1 Tax=Ichthyophthirius multifiliis TaxID=5932 RepID=G0QXA7_ICHMU|nr:hypothetical protein IMG5_140270 [Ichthyophthirius multifiliis]EGR30148.1 hypothetical protein IMG5_140270 [Ichthyophthirius multifiliis]|eukprot:XP_004031384.1 hypothetical protein IMG5_140270 [Ichthyophthirius multifiliis]